MHFFLTYFFTPHLKSGPRYVRLRESPRLDLIMRELRHVSRIVDRSAFGQRLHNLRSDTHDQISLGVRIAGIAEQSTDVLDVAKIRNLLDVGLLLVQDQV
jgi:hypothetical protein